MLKFLISYAVEPPVISASYILFSHKWNSDIFHLTNLTFAVDTDITLSRKTRCPVMHMISQLLGEVQTKQSFRCAVQLAW